MADLAVRNLTRRFPSGGGVLDVSLDVPSGEFVVLLGPSGCGKTTLLRMIAGLEYPDSGEIRIGANGDSGSTTHRESIAMVFQNFALYPHMTVFQNIAFPLKLRRVARDEIERRVKESAAKAGLAVDLGRFPRELSGGERQRVALARALVREPEIILMDEALASLDAQLRSSLRVELKTFQRRLGRTFVYVTHDQAEALALADRLVVMRAGKVEQVGTPQEIFDLPQSEFVAAFVGNPPMNFFSAERAPQSGSLIVEGIDLKIKAPEGCPAQIRIGIRPEYLAVEKSDGSVAIDVVVESVEFSGASYVVYAKLGNSSIRAALSRHVEPGAHLTLYLDAARLHFFDPSTGRRIGNSA
ncbi:MAG TPA: ABC transporter ATP-binding protein [Candidatus Sulfotelmatobacter sp.]|jgi:ABC-type sugar transport system ATPase subunit|nr:ABC transporter ATP-binding protein [Candidatus Sulfotelmatobacter sp.]